MSTNFGVYQNRSNVLPPLGIAWFESELRSIGATASNEQEFQEVLSEFRLRISRLEPWRQDAEMKLLLEEVREFQTRESETRFASTDWHDEARDKLNQVDAAMFDDLREQEEREKAKDVERRAKCAELGRQFRLAN